MQTMRSLLFAAVVLSAVSATATGDTPSHISVSGDYGYRQYKLRRAAPGTTIDARGAYFRLANSRNAHPDADNDCKRGELPLNRYPMSIRATDRLLLKGGVIRGEVPQESDWSHTYCNSAAIGLRESPNATVESVRIHRSWDAVRFSKNSPNFRLTGVWVSDARDDCVENDQLKSGVIRDSLFDGCFYGVSMDPARNTPSVSSTDEVLELDGVLMRMATYLARGRKVQGVPFKMHPSSPKLRILNSVFAFDNPNIAGLSRLKRAWEKTIACRNNLLLWMSDKPLPLGFPKAPDCFRLLHGNEALTFWNALRQNWINCHSDLNRLKEDVTSQRDLCKL